MKKNKKSNKNKKYINNNGLFLQAIFTTLVVIFMLMSMFEKNFTYLMQLFLSLDLFTMAYNNETSYAKYKMTLVYSITGLITLIYFIYNMIKVVM